MGLITPVWDQGKNSILTRSWAIYNKTSVSTSFLLTNEADLFYPSNEKLKLMGQGLDTYTLVI